jgi:hypothetical protein
VGVTLLHVFNGSGSDEAESSNGREKSLEANHFDF